MAITGRPPVTTEILVHLRHIRGSETTVYSTASSIQGYKGYWHRLNRLTRKQDYMLGGQFWTSFWQPRWIEVHGNVSHNHISLYSGLSFSNVRLVLVLLPWVEYGHTVAIQYTKLQCPWPMHFGFDMTFASLNVINYCHLNSVLCFCVQIISRSV